MLRANAAAHGAAGGTDTETADAEAAYELAEAFCEQSRVRIEELFHRLWNNTDDLDRRIATRALAGDYEWLEAGVLDPSEGTGPWIASWHPGPSNKESVARRYR
jgi:hypothetical protein